MQTFTDYSLLHHNSFGLDVKARKFVEYENIHELQHFLFTHDSSEPLLHIGGGNNLLFTKDFEGTVLHSAIKGFEEIGRDGHDVHIRLGAAMTWDRVIESTLRRGYFGLENLSSIPSEVGAAVVQNIGAYGAEIKDFVESVEAVSLTTGEVHEFSNEDCGFAYRHSNFKGPWRGQYAVTHVTLKLSLDFKPNLSYHTLADHASGKINATDLREMIVELRSTKLPDPKVLGNAGSFFMNPVVSRETYERISRDYPTVPHYSMPNGVKIPAGWLIEKCGWKGKTMGRAAVYSKQALVLVNMGGATPQDIVSLAEAVCADVKSKFDIQLESEVIWV